MRTILILAVLLVTTSCSSPIAPAPTATPEPVVFDAAQAYEYVLAQMAIGPRPVGSRARDATAAYISDRLREAGWQVEEQTFVYRGVSVDNVIGRKGQGPVLIVGAHYDTRRVADQDPRDPSQPVPGANDGASGVAVLLELARSLDMRYIPYEIWLTFFDGEDNGGLDGWGWGVGSAYMAGHLTVTPRAMILVDMVGDRDQQLYLEQNSTPALRDAIWATAAQLGYSAYFIPRAKWPMTDDHTAFLQRGIPAVDIIDFDYPYYHTAADTADKVSPDSLGRVGLTLEAYLESGALLAPGYP